ENDISYLITSLPNDQALMNVLYDNRCVIESCNKKFTLIELSTVLPKTIKKIQQDFADLKMKVLDCPISGGPIEARQGDVHLIISGEQEIYTQSENILNLIGKNINYVGEEVGEAKAIKLINNIMTMGNVLVAAEAFSFGLKYGINPEKLYSILSQTGGTSHHFKKRFPKVINNDYSPLFSMELGKKDLSLAEEWTNNLRYENKITSFITEQYSKAIDEGRSNEDIVAVIK